MSDETDRLEQIIDVLEPELRRLGVYIDHSNIASEEETGDKPMLVIDASVGSVAFSRRVQDPEQFDFDREFKKMTFGAIADDFLDTRAQFEARLAEGRPLLGDAE